MPKTHISRSINIDAPYQEMHDKLSNLHHWQAWSPWLICEPEAQVNIDNDGKHYSWQGNRVGSGSITVISQDDNLIDYDLQFIKPWKSQAKVSFILEPNDTSTLVTWTMDSSLPFFMFWMKKKMEAFIGMDYERGLKMLKEYIEKGHVNSRLEFMGITTFKGCDYIGIERHSLFSKIDTDMSTDFTQLGKFITSHNIATDGVAFSQYKKFDVVSGAVHYIVGFPVKEIPQDLDNRFIKGNLPTTTMNTIRHHGPYDHVGNAWSASMMMLRNKEFKPRKKYDPIEFYINDPTQTDPNDLISDICFATQ